MHSIKVENILVIFLGLCALARFGYAKRTDIQVGMPIPIEDHIREMGYPVETHDIVTEDGYILTYHRIPYGRVHAVGQKRPPVLVQHGVGAVSRVWAVVNNSLGFALADAGYDVWLANARGTYYSRKHVSYDPDKDKKIFWNFSWHEMGYYDIPAAIDYILNTTGHSQVSYVGHSMGTTMYFVLGATRPEYMSKVKVSALMAPVAHLKSMPSLLNVLHVFQAPISGFIKAFGLYEFFPYGKGWYWLVHKLCGPKDTQFICKDVIGSLCGFDNAQLDSELLPSYVDFMPGGTSAKTMIHFGQIMSKAFRQYDYGLLGNLKKYRSFSPPSYNLQNVNAPTHLYLAANDWIVSPDVAIYTAHKLPNLKGLKLVDLVDFSHGDFMWAKDVKSLVYDDLVATINKYL